MARGWLTSRERLPSRGVKGFPRVWEVVPEALDVRSRSPMSIIEANGPNHH
jgi:hypothetical protein